MLETFDMGRTSLYFLKFRLPFVTGIHASILSNTLFAAKINNIFIAPQNFFLFFSSSGNGLGLRSDV